MIKTQRIQWSPFSDKHKEYIRTAINNRLNVAEGAIRSGKTIDNCIIAAMYLETCADTYHLASGSTLGNAKLNIGVCNGFGLEALFRGRCHWGKFKDNEALFINSQTGEKVVIFVGGGKADSYKRILGNSYGLWIATEINEHFDSDDSRISFIKVAMGRQVAAKAPMVLWDLNPCNPSHRIYSDYIDKYKEDFVGGYQYKHFTLADNLSIPEQRKIEIASQYDENSVWYKRDILGQRIAAEGLIYDMFDTKKHVVRLVPENGEGNPVLRDYIEYVLACDYGTQNATVFGLFGYCKGVWYLIREYYHSGRETQKQKTDEEYYQDLIVFVDDIPVQTIILDPSAASFITCIRRHGRFTVLPANNSVVDGIRFTGSLFQSGKLYICECCEYTLQEIQGYCWDPKSSEDKPVKEADHCMDMLRYFCYTHIRRNAYKYGIHLLGRKTG